ncbi:uncharacterized protein LOC134191573 [Corticium candelabrum]|uniref:uncharacterized protein LOC134191573 n=1 Tax=Corticium candelabrum TaxID=121492 RepID=UPI002E27645E|nr:uncharacterized protein LOC134191573 [Corticium candelabrum]
MSDQFDLARRKRYLDRRFQPVGRHGRLPRGFVNHRKWSLDTEISEGKPCLEQPSDAKWSHDVDITLPGSIFAENSTLANTESVENEHLQLYGKISDIQPRPVGRRGTRTRHAQGLHSTGSHRNIRCSFSLSSVAGLRSAKEEYCDYAKVCD